MESWEPAVAYHQRTKHHFGRYARSLGFLDWSTQPDPFRRYADAPLVSLLLSGDRPTPAYDDLFRPGAIPPRPVDFTTVSGFLELSLALSAWKQFKDSRWALRINPSSGNLHPTEGYLVLGPIQGIHDRPGVYHYAPREHALERRTEFSLTAWEALLKGFPPETFLAGLTSIHWREAWKYGERAYRYCQHDVGHALAALSLSAAISGWRVVWLHAVSDSQAAAMLGVDRETDFLGAEREEPDLLVAVVPRWGVHDPRALPVDGIKLVSMGEWSGRANALSSDHVEWDVIDMVTQACAKPETSPASLSNPSIVDGAAADSAPVQRPEISATIIIRRRRSAVALDGTTSIGFDRFFSILDRTMPRLDRTPWDALGSPVCVHLGLMVHRVDGLPPGLYCLVREPSQLPFLREAMSQAFLWEKPPECPLPLPLYQLLAGDSRQVAEQVSCGQEIAADGVFSCGMIAEFDASLRRFGGWFYRRLFWEAGVIGQMLYLEAEAAGIRGTGIGCFFDDPVHDLFGLRDTTYQSLYHFTIGGPKEDFRLMTWLPYS